MAFGGEYTSEVKRRTQLILEFFLKKEIVP
jgi:hypothetical protein